MIITIAARKGGAGKTTTAAAMAQAIRNKNKKTNVLLIDMDGQSSLTGIYGADKMPGPTIYEALKGKCDITETIRHTSLGDIVPGSVYLSGLDVEFSKTPGRDFILNSKVKTLTGTYTHIIIDTPPGISTNLIQSLTAAETVIIPTECDYQAVNGVFDVLETVREVRNLCNEDLTVSGLLAIRYNSRSVITKQFEELLKDTATDYGTKLFKTKIRQGVAIRESQALHKDLYKYAPKSNPAVDYMNLVKEMKL